MAVKFASEFGAEYDAAQAAMAHDVGKYSKEFARHINNPDLPMRVDHSTAGAQLIGGICPAAFAVAGHHGGLPDGGNKYVDDQYDSTLAGRLKRTVPDYCAWKSADIEIPKGKAPDFCMHADKFTWQFYTRMLYSCLVDADYLDTEHFMQPDKERCQARPVAELKNMLDEFTSKFYPPKTELNEKRCTLLDACKRRGSFAKGMYSLTVPTGGGKTLASMTFAMSHAVLHGMKRIIYVIPYTSIIDQTAEVFKNIFGNENVLEHHSGVDYDDTERGLALTLATENWDMPIIVTTAVQFFESLYANRSSKCRKLHNITNSVIIFDEAQTLPVPYLLPCVAAISELVKNYGSTAVLCTATQPVLDEYFDEYGLEVKELCPIKEELFLSLKRVRFENMGQTHAEDLSKQLQGFKSVLCVVNKRKTVQELFSMIDGNGVYALTTLLCPAHRKRLFKEIKDRLSAGLQCIVISTSLIEAGVDLDFERVYREETGMDSVLQAAGRCNREGLRSRESSIVTVFSLDESANARVAQAVESARRVWQSFSEPDSLEAIESYFKFYRYIKGRESLDRNGILAAFERGIEGCSYPFAQVAQKFRLIDSPTKTIYVPFGEGAELIDELRSREVSKALFRKLGDYCVNVYPEHFSTLDSAGALEILASGDAVLIDTSKYDLQTGLKLDVGTNEFLEI